MHFIDDFAYDHGENEEWNGIDVDWAYSCYFHAARELADCGIYDGITHPDLLKLFGHKPSFSLAAHYDRLAAALAAGGMYAEQSGGAHRRYPDTCGSGMEAGLLAAMKRRGVRILTASDAHCPEDVGFYVKEMELILSKYAY